MQTKVAQFHRKLWNYQKQCGIGIIHYEPLGVFAFVFQSGVIPTEPINFAEATEIKYWQENFKKSAIALTYGCQIDRDRGSALVKATPQGYSIPELNLELRINFTALAKPGDEHCGLEFKLGGNFKEFDSPVFEYFECTSVLFNTNKNLVIKEFKPDVVIPPVTRTVQQVVPEVRRINHAQATNQDTAIITINATPIK